MEPETQTIQNKKSLIYRTSCSLVFEVWTSRQKVAGSDPTTEQDL